MNTIIEGKFGIFYGSYSKSSRLPEGNGVFKEEKWLHCGKVKDRAFLVGRKLSVSKELKSFEMTHSKWLGDGSLVQRI